MSARRSEHEKRERKTGSEPDLTAQASASDADATTHDIGESASVESSHPFASREWKRSLEETTGLYAAALKDGSKLAASSLHAQASLLENLAKSKTPSDVMKFHLDFAERLWSKSISEG
ncbi:hypothetical protein [Bradyrhizobium sp. SBR1B]|uniref:hypothetical protein n=1 Tax=Bradyrhizobium sp. SBR1B TaxID=2663836 RepID=UPI001606CF30|nr:hypothetical protein [Bradyrhizobium sp. SBR1B]MBB4383363.1 transcription initiation factor TFIID subunit TAF12 [Bradyrhizobium sp. SBR1B]